MSRTFVIPDLHGHLIAFERMLLKIGFDPHDKLYLLGDYIDRGPDSRALVDRIMELIVCGYHVFPLRGNHEQMLLDTTPYLEEVSFGANKRKLPFLNEEQRVDTKYLDFFSSLPHYYELPDYYLVHAGLNCMAPDPFADQWSMLWMRYNDRRKHTLTKPVICGHTPHTLSEIQHALAQNAACIPLDNGVYKRELGYGNLLCLELPTRRLHVVPAHE